MTYVDGEDVMTVLDEVYSAHGRDANIDSPRTPATGGDHTGGDRCGLAADALAWC